MLVQFFSFLSYSYALEVKTLSQTEARPASFIMPGASLLLLLSGAHIRHTQIHRHKHASLKESMFLEERKLPLSIRISGCFAASHMKFRWITDP